MSIPTLPCIAPPEQITRRDWFAGLAMHAFCQEDGIIHALEYYDDLAKDSYGMADMMLANSKNPLQPVPKVQD